MSPLSTIPHVVILGGEQAAQNVRLMLKTEAAITAAAPALDPELAALPGSRPPQLRARPRGKAPGAHAWPQDRISGVIVAAARTGRRVATPASSTGGKFDSRALVTGTTRPGDPAPDWASLVRPGTTLAIYMGVTSARETRANPLAGGAPDGSRAETI